MFVTCLSYLNLSGQCFILNINELFYVYWVRQKINTTTTATTTLIDIVEDG